MNHENDAKSFLVLITKTLSLILLWMLINMLLGLYLGFGLFDAAPTWKNWLYYFFAAGSLYFVLKYIIKKWRSTTL